jgi:four helix bundle protein
MEENTNNQFNHKFSERTELFAISVYKMVKSASARYLDQVGFKQLFRSATSAAANFKAATRARSLAEYYAKICIVLEEMDESLYWINFVSKTNMIGKDKIEPIIIEAEILTKVFSKTRMKLKEKKDSKKQPRKK